MKNVTIFLKTFYISRLEIFLIGGQTCNSFQSSSIQSSDQGEISSLIIFYPGKSTLSFKSQGSSLNDGQFPTNRGQVHWITNQSIFSNRCKHRESIGNDLKHSVGLNVLQSCLVDSIDDSNQWKRKILCIQFKSLLIAG